MDTRLTGSKDQQLESDKNSEIYKLKKINTETPVSQAPASHPTEHPPVTPTALPPREGLQSQQMESAEMQEARRVDELADWVPSTEQSARESAGSIRRPPDGRPSMIGVTDTPKAAPKPQPGRSHPHDFTRRDYPEDQTK